MMESIVNAKQKKLEQKRIILTNIFMLVSVVVIVILVTLLAMGYGFRNGDLEVSGLLRIKSSPSGAMVEINGKELFWRTETSEMLSPGEHEVVVTKTGYDTWRSRVLVESGFLTRLDWVRLFPIERQTQEVLYYDAVRFASVSPDRQSVLVVNGEGIWNLVERINSDRPTERVLGIDGVFAGMEGSFRVVEWSNNRDKILVQRTTDGVREWVMIDTAGTGSASRNLTREFLMDFSEMTAISDSANRLFAVENGNLRTINLNDSVVSGVLATGVSDIFGNGATVAMLQTGTDEVRTINIYRDGEKGSSEIVKVPEDVKQVGVLIGTYFGENWMACHLDGQLIVRKGSYPSYGKTTSELKIVKEMNMGFLPSRIAMSPYGKIVVMVGGDTVVSVNMELVSTAQFDFMNAAKFSWLDDYLLATNFDGELKVIDFDGSNLRNMGKAVPGLPAVVSENNRWLYYFVEKPGVATDGEEEMASTVELVRERLN